MNIVIIFCIYYFIIIILFTFIYYYLSDDHFYIDSQLIYSNKLDLIDYINFSVNIQSTVGLPSIRGKTQIARIIITIQQLLLVFSIFVVYYYHNN